MTDDVPLKDPATFVPDFTQPPYRDILRFGREYLGLDMRYHGPSQEATLAYWARQDVREHYLKSRPAPTKPEVTPSYLAEQAEIERLSNLANSIAPVSSPDHLPFWPLRDGITMKDIPQ